MNQESSGGSSEEEHSFSSSFLRDMWTNFKRWNLKAVKRPAPMRNEAAGCLADDQAIAVRGRT